eukprot:TRINITY_DN44046_c0_g1_i1.p1 TRINITY_DN44046_c0_g1~~TRINITY_DN44046_c0_g1_i1.p1  ORF type:complete len:308 (+),score=37.70 TRINITY_DN44046_c0_g1_i1:506-1429(+)
MGAAELGHTKSETVAISEGVAHDAVVVSNDGPLSDVEKRVLDQSSRSVSSAGCVGSDRAPPEHLPRSPPSPSCPPTLSRPTSSPSLLGCSKAAPPAPVRLPLVHSPMAAGSFAGSTAATNSQQMEHVTRLPISSVNANGFRFDPTVCSESLEVITPHCLRCRVNATRTSQGVCFLEPPVLPGQIAQIRVRLDNKPGRMRYFLGVARRRFAVDARDADLRSEGWSIENLYSGVHQERKPCMSKAAPIFHTGSVVTITVDLQDPARSELTFVVDTTGVQLKAPLPGRSLEGLSFWVSLYNRFAQFSLSE